jgi:hypothetical protein
LTATWEIRANLGPHADDGVDAHGWLWEIGRGVTEGSVGVWARLRYDWSDPSHIVLTTTDSNVWGGASGFTYTLSPQPDGTTEVDVVVVREGKNLKGRMLGAEVAIFGKRILGKSFGKTLKAIEARTRAEN